MSYILDALRKSDQQRQRGTTPTLLAVQENAAAPRQPASLAYGLIAAVLIGVGVVIGWLRPWHSEQTAPATPEVVAASPRQATPLNMTPPESTPVPSTPATPSSQTMPQPQPEPVLQSTTAEPAPSASAARPKPKRPARATVDEAGSPREAETPATERAAAPAPPVDLADGTSVPTVVEMRDLPLQVRQSLPAMAISFHAYSGTPDSRLVGINNRIRREGDTIAPGLLLEQITPDGMIFGYEGYRFRRGVN